MDKVKRTIRRLEKELLIVNKKLSNKEQLYYQPEITEHRLEAQKNTIEWVLRMLVEGDFEE